MSLRLYMDTHVRIEITIGQCVDDLELVAKIYEPAEMMNQVLHLPLR
jgi:hypothetical protein